MSDRLRILVIEPYYGGSHKAFIDGLMGRLNHEITLISQPPRKWKWRMRGGAMHAVGECTKLLSTGARFDMIITSSMLSLAEFKGMVPKELANLPCLLVMHENQFAYPVKTHDLRDIHFGLTNLTSCLSADRIVWNSQFNLDSFKLGVVDTLRMMPDERPEWVLSEIEKKSEVMPLPVDGPSAVSSIKTGPPHILWNHRWEHDKGPEMFFRAVSALAESGVDFSVSVIGQSFQRVPSSFAEAKEMLSDRIVHWGYQEGREGYQEVLDQADIVISTAIHEFYGLAVLEAVAAGCRPLLPAALSYPELFPPKYLYRDEDQLRSELRNLCDSIDEVRTQNHSVLVQPYLAEQLIPEWNRLILATARREPLTL